MSWKQFRMRILTLAALLLSHTSLAQSTVPATQPARAFARYVPEAFDDVAWENDRIAFRVYGPALEREQQTGSGIDVWVKSTRRLVIDRWYKANNYGVDHGEGLDCYSVNTGRGCGGLGIWNGKTLDVSRTWKSHKIVDGGPDRAVIELTYAQWRSGDRNVWETRRITLETGSNLNRIESTIGSDQPGDITVAIGINKRLGEGEVRLEKKTGLVAVWQPAEGKNGNIGCGIRIDPDQLVRFVDTPEQYLALLRVTPGKPFVYYSGAGWSKSGSFPDFGSWEKYLRGYVVDFVRK